MGRKKTLSETPRAAVVQFRCTRAYKDGLIEMATRGGYRDLAAMIEAAFARERERLQMPPLPPR